MIRFSRGEDFAGIAEEKYQGATVKTEKPFSWFPGHPVPYIYTFMIGVLVGLIIAWVIL